MREYCVYKHTFPNGKIYIGITSMKPCDRWKNGKGYRDNTLIGRAIQKYGWDNVRHEIIKTGLNQEEACKAEIDLIKKERSCDNKIGYNIEMGGIYENKVVSQDTGKNIKPGCRFGKYITTGNYYKRGTAIYLEVEIPEGGTKYSQIKSLRRTRARAKEIRATENADEKALIYSERMIKNVEYMEQVWIDILKETVCGVDMLA